VEAASVSSSRNITIAPLLGPAMRTLVQRGHIRGPGLGEGKCLGQKPSGLKENMDPGVQRCVHGSGHSRLPGRETSTLGQPACSPQCPRIHRAHREAGGRAEKGRKGTQCVVKRLVGFPGGFELREPIPSSSGSAGAVPHQGLRLPQTPLGDAFFWVLWGKAEAEVTESQAGKAGKERCSRQLESHVQRPCGAQEVRCRTGSQLEHRLAGHDEPWEDRATLCRACGPARGSLCHPRSRDGGTDGC
jgi:hypothetical protein